MKRGDIDLCICVCCCQIGVTRSHVGGAMLTVSTDDKSRIWSRGVGGVSVNYMQ